MSIRKKNVVSTQGTTGVHTIAFGVASCFANQKHFGVASCFASQKHSREGFFFFFIRKLEGVWCGCTHGAPLGSTQSRRRQFQKKKIEEGPWEPPGRSYLLCSPVAPDGPANQFMHPRSHTKVNNTTGTHHPLQRSETTI